MQTREQYLLAQGAEEAVEVAKRLIKALRFGVRERQPDQTLDNHERIRQEFCDLVAVLDEIDPTMTAYSGEEFEAKKAKIEKYLSYARRLGEVEP